MERIGHYRIMSELGRGGMGVVFKAHEESLNRYVAIKVLGEHLAADPSYVQRFVREAQSAARLNHPNIVQIHVIGEDEGKHYFVMEYVHGTSLQQLLKARGHLAVQDASRMVMQAAAGLAAAHDQGVIHRDIKPANLLIDERGLLKIADFGLALLHAAASRLTATGMFMGTPGYLSPEQCMEKDIDQRTDIYSLGITFYETLAGRAPFTSSSPLALLRQIMEVEPPDVRELNPGVDEGTRAILLRMIAKDRERRYATCHEVISELQAHLDRLTAAGQGLGAGPAVVASPVTPVAAATTTVNHDPAMGGTPTRVVDSGPSAAAHAAAPPIQQPQPTPAPALPLSATAAVATRAWGPLIAIAAVVLIALGVAVGSLIVILAPDDPEQVVTHQVVVPVVAEQVVVPVADDPVQPPAAAEVPAQPTPTPEAVPATAIAPTPVTRVVVVTATPQPREAPRPTVTPRPTRPSLPVVQTPAAAVVTQAVPTPPPTATATPEPDEVDALILDLNTGDGAAQQRAAKILYRTYRKDPRVPEAASQALLRGIEVGLDDERHVDAMAWLCNILGASGNPIYLYTLETVVASKTNRKIRKFAAKNAGRLE